MNSEKDEITYAYRLKSNPSGRMYVNDDQWLEPKPENTQFDLTNSKQYTFIVNGEETMYVGAFKGPVLDRVKR